MEDQGEIFGDVERGGIISARGTGDGLVIRIDGRVAEGTLRGVIEDFLKSRRSFLEGNEVALEWVGSKPSDDFVEELSHSVFRDYDVTVKVSKLRDVKAPREIVEDDEMDMDPAEVVKLTTSLGRQVPSKGDEDFEKTPSRRKGSSAGLFGGIEAITSYDKDSGSSRGKSPVGGDTGLWDDADARIVYATLRSGQKIETEHSLILFGDLNSGAEIVAGGDIVVLGTLRGVAHAGAYDETGGGRVIVALNLQPTQLRIGMVISRGASDSRSVAEVARIDGNSIVVEPYNARVVLQRHK